MLLLSISVKTTPNYQSCCKLIVHTQHGKDESVCEVPVQRQFDHVAAQTKRPGGLHQAGEDVALVKEYH
jgi:hypothetical protein